MGAGFCCLAKFRKRCVLFSMNEVKRLAKESLELDVRSDSGGEVREYWKALGSFCAFLLFSVLRLFFEKIKSHNISFVRTCFELFSG